MDWREPTRPSPVLLSIDLDHCDVRPPGCTIAERNISGFVIDPSSAAIAGAEIVAVDDATGVQYPTKTDHEGMYVVPNLPPEKPYGASGLSILNVRGWQQTVILHRSLMDGGFFEFRRQLLQSAVQWRNHGLSPINGFLQASCVLAAVQSKLLALWQRMFRCQECGFQCDRDQIAARNLERGTLNVWPQSLRCQPVERNALTRFARTA